MANLRTSQVPIKLSYYTATAYQTAEQVRKRLFTFRHQWCRTIWRSIRFGARRPGWIATAGLDMDWTNKDPSAKEVVLGSTGPHLASSSAGAAPCYDYLPTYLGNQEPTYTVSLYICNVPR